MNLVTSQVQMHKCFCNKSLTGMQQIFRNVYLECNASCFGLQHLPKALNAMLKVVCIVTSQYSHGNKEHFHKWEVNLL